MPHALTLRPRASRVAAVSALIAAALAVGGCGSPANLARDVRTSTAPAVRQSEWKSVIRDAYDGLVEHAHPCAAVREAVRHLPPDRTFTGQPEEAILAYERAACQHRTRNRPTLVARRTQDMTTVPSNHGYSLTVALARLHAAGLRATFPATSTPCGSGLPVVNVQSPRAPARVARGTTITIRFMPSMIASPVVPKHHRKYAIVPKLIGLEAEGALRRLDAIWPCVDVLPAHATAATRLAVVGQTPRAATRVPAFGVMVGRGYRPTTMRIVLGAR
jgi:hypothetical protein